MAAAIAVGREGLGDNSGRGEKIIIMWPREILWLHIPHSPPRGKKLRLMEYIHQSVIVLDEDENGTRQNKNNQAMMEGFQTSNQHP